MEKITAKDVFENLTGFLEELKPLIGKDTISLAPFTLGFFKYWGKDIKIGDEEFEVQCEKDLNENWKHYVAEAKIPDCLLNRDVSRELLNIDCTWVPKNSGPYYISPDSDTQLLSTLNPHKSYIYLAVEHAEDTTITLEGSNLGPVITAMRKLGYIKSLFKIVIYKPFKGEKMKNEPKIQEQLNKIQEEIKRIGLYQEKERTETWLIIMLFNHYESSSIKIGEKDLLLRAFELNNTGEVIKIGENDYNEYQIEDFYA